MRGLVKYSNFGVFLVCLGVFFALFDGSKLSTNILDLFPKVAQRELIDLHLELASQNEILIALPQSSQNSPINSHSADSAIDSASAQSTESTLDSTQNTSDSKNENFSAKSHNGKNENSLKDSKNPPDSTLNAQSYNDSSSDSVLDCGDSADCVESSKILKTLKSLDEITQITHLKDNVYLINFSKNISTEDFYASFKEAIKGIEGLKYFSSDILRVENSNAIFDDVNVIMACSITFLIVMYLFILRIPFLSLNTLITIISANLLGITIITLAFENVNIMALNFGVAIGNLAIDYMLHHHFFRHYMHKFAFNKSVFYGFITSFIGFFICLFIPFPLLSQLSLYAMICLLVSYLSFGILYQFIGFKKPIFFRKIRRFRKPKVSSKIIAILAILGLALGVANLELDYNLERLDYQNKPRLSDRDYFRAVLGSSSEVLIFSTNKEDLLPKALEIAQKTPIKSDIRNLNVVEKDGRFYAAISVESVDSIKDLDFVESRSIDELSNEITSGIYKPMLLILAIVIASMITIVLLITRSITGLVYIIAPLAAIFLYFLSIKVNIMHLFSLLIVVVSSIDYGIYVQKEGENIKTLHAIIFSALTTIAGFGFLAFSNILALKSFGVTILLGLCVILLLLLFQRRKLL